LAIVFSRSIAIPLWAVGFGAAALSGPSRTATSLAVLLGVAGVTCGFLCIARWSRRTRPASGLSLEAGATGDEALHLVRMDDDGWQMPQQPATVVTPIQTR
jgi:hypothetical protein